MVCLPKLLLMIRRLPDIPRPQMGVLALNPLEAIPQDRTVNE